LTTTDLVARVGEPELVAHSHYTAGRRGVGITVLAWPSRTRSEGGRANAGEHRGRERAPAAEIQNGQPGRRASRVPAHHPHLVAGGGDRPERARDTVRLRIEAQEGVVIEVADPRGSEAGRQVRQPVVPNVMGPTSAGDDLIRHGRTPAPTTIVTATAAAANPITAATEGAPPRAAVSHRVSAVRSAASSRGVRPAAEEPEQRLVAQHRCGHAPIDIARASRL
jgi:hypothetical protein